MHNGFRIFHINVHYKEDFDGGAFAGAGGAIDAGRGGGANCE